MAESFVSVLASWAPGLRCQGFASAVGSVRSPRACCLYEVTGAGCGSWQ